jgi:TRAP-type C4-dicarboxylate transport system permease small subunit
MHPHRMPATCRQDGGRWPPKHYSGDELKILSLLARVCAVLAGMILTAITLVTCISLIGRNTVGVTLVGDYELTAVAAGAAVALFLPWCQVRRENIIVDFFTTRLSDTVNNRLDRLGSLVLAALMLVLAWRTGVGGLGAFNANSTSMMLGFPEWVVYAAMVPPMVLTAAIALAQTLVGNFEEQGQ